MIEEGKITAEEGKDLLEALDQSAEIPAGSAASGRFLRVRIDSEKGTKVKLKVPLGLVRVASKLCEFATYLIPDQARRELEQQGINISDIDCAELVTLLEQGLSDGDLIDAEAIDDKEGLTKVKVYID